MNKDTNRFWANRLNPAGTCTRCGGKFPSRTSGIEPGSVLCTSADQCDRNLATIVDEAGRELGGYAGERREVDRRATTRPGVERRREVRPATAEGQAEANAEAIAECQQEGRAR